MIQTIIGLGIVIVAIPACVFFYKNALERSKSNKTSLFGSFNNEYGEKDNLFKTTPSFLEGLDEAEKKRATK